MNNNIIVFDLETTADDAHDITEIGAVALNSKLEVIDRFSELVNIKRPVDEKSKLITGITDEMLSKAKDKGVVLTNFTRFVEKQGNIKKARLSAWGNYFDINILRQNMPNFPFSGTAIDVKSLAFMWASLSGHRTDKMSVKIVSEDYMKLASPLGGYHRAVVDAEQTALILQRIFKDFSEGVFLSNKTYVKVSI